MGRRLFPSLSMTEETATEETAPAENTPKSSSNVPAPEGQVVGYKSGAFKLDREKKKAEIWIVDTLYRTTDYTKVISLIHSLTKEFVLHIYIHSPGGSIAVGCNLLTAMQRCRATIITHNIGIAASCGSLILAFGHKIRVDPLTITMFHNSAYGSFESTHRMLTQTKHLANMTQDLFNRMIKLGVMLESEMEDIVKKGQEFYLTADVMTARLKNAGIWYDGEI